LSSISLGSERWSAQAQDRNASVPAIRKTCVAPFAFLHEMLALNIELYLFQQALDTTTPSGRAMFQLLGVFAEFERAIIVERVNSGIAKAREKGTKSGKPIGRPSTPPRTREAIRKMYRAGGVGMRAVAKKFGVSPGTVQTCLREQKPTHA
jgi:DNA invertase Pin-like site-specific DNA recombinase